MSKECIRIGGAREHNLKNLTLEIPRDKLVVITGLSGSGKSSLAFDTIYAEGQRKYVESLSAYARQFLERRGRISFFPIKLAREFRDSNSRQEIVRQQDAFLTYGVRHLRPLNLKTVADAISMHVPDALEVTWDEGEWARLTTPDLLKDYARMAI